MEQIFDSATTDSIIVTNNTRQDVFVFRFRRIDANRNQRRPGCRANEGRW
jgi:hypothetical protein